MPNGAIERNANCGVEFGVIDFVQTIGFIKFGVFYRVRSSLMLDSPGEPGDDGQFTVLIVSHRGTGSLGEGKETLLKTP